LQREIFQNNGLTRTGFEKPFIQRTGIGNFTTDSGLFCRLGKKKGRGIATA
jgi:hypothetical protein